MIFGTVIAFHIKTSNDADLNETRRELDKNHRCWREEKNTEPTGSEELPYVT